MSEPMKNPPARKTQTAKRNYQKEMEKVLDAAVRDGRVPTLFLHSCCAPCSSYVLEYLSQYFSITVFYYNPNISPKEEYEARTEEVQRLIRELPAVHPIRFVEGKYDPECYYEAVRGHEKDPEGGERCGICFEMRLREAAKLAAEGGERVAEFAARNWKTILIVAVFGLLALLLITGLQSCTVMAGTAGTGVTASSYFSKDKDMLGAEKAYAKLEQKLQRYLDTYEATHNYDEYHFYLDEIEHDPYVLISILSALHDGVFTLAEVQGELEMLFEKQYILTETVTMQIRYRTKMMVIIGPYGVPQVITYQEPYEYYICTVKLKNKDLSHLPVEVLTEEQLSAYSLYMRTLGNRPDLFGQAQYPNASTIKQPTYYDIPPEALKDDKFAAMMEEATKYIGYPYVWGGSSPSTSFDCSGYISWVLNHSGWNVGRQTAQGLYNLCTPVSTAQVKPGDLVFFKGTYDTPGVSHCGIYVGNSIMLHCGDPISYTNLNSKYWQEHFYSYGRLP